MLPLLLALAMSYETTADNISMYVARALVTVGSIDLGVRLGNEGAGAVPLALELTPGAPRPRFAKFSAMFANEGHSAANVIPGAGLAFVAVDGALGSAFAASWRGSPTWSCEGTLSRLRMGSRRGVWGRSPHRESRLVFEPAQLI